MPRMYLASPVEIAEVLKNLQVVEVKQSFTNIMSGDRALPGEERQIVFRMNGDLRQKGQKIYLKHMENKKDRDYL